MEKIIEVFSPNGVRLAPCTKRRATQMLERGAAVRKGNNAVMLKIDPKALKQIKKDVLNRDRYTCYITGKQLSPAEATVDHIISRARGGTDSPDNLACCAKEHNKAKGTMGLNEYIQFLVSNPETDDNLRRYLLAKGS